jgi:hypothetical protein
MIGAMTIIKNSLICDNSAQNFYFNGRNSFIGAYRALEDRGLAEHNKAIHEAGGSRKAAAGMIWVYRLTPEGEKVFELLMMSGLISSVKKEKVES